MFIRSNRLVVVLSLAVSFSARPDTPASATDAYLEKTRPRWEQVSRQIWELAETGLEETRSSALVADAMWMKAIFELPRLPPEVEGAIHERMRLSTTKPHQKH